MRIVVVIFIVSLILFSFVASANSTWEEQSSSLKLSVGQFTMQGSRSDSDVTNTNISFNLLNLYQGVGIRAAGLYGRKHTSFGQYDVKDDYNAKLATRVFLTDSSNFDIGYSKSQSVSLARDFESGYRVHDSAIELFQDSSSFLDLNLGSDQDIRSFSFGVDSSERDTFVNRHFSHYGSERRLTLSARFQNQISEDTYAVFQYGEIGHDKTQAKRLQEVKIKNSYIGFKTRYLGASALEVLLGQSESDNELTSQTSRIDSWQVTNQLALTDYFIVLFSAGKMIQDSNDVTFSTNDVVTYRFSTSYQPSTNWSLNFGLSQHVRDLTSSISAREFSSTMSVDYQILEDWLISVKLDAKQLKDDRPEFSFDESSFMLGVSWRAF